MPGGPHCSVNATSGFRGSSSPAKKIVAYFNTPLTSSRRLFSARSLRNPPARPPLRMRSGRVALVVHYAAPHGLPEDHERLGDPDVECTLGEHSERCSVTSRPGYVRLCRSSRHENHPLCCLSMSGGEVGSVHPARRPDRSGLRQPQHPPGRQAETGTRPNTTGSRSLALRQP
ncbi:hypothetical protein OV450_7686 [Actinobacteria bacterium OV450]|nr:hypothetical protein OV450_7686 [Actinobacteria bacterium OV450]